VAFGRGGGSVRVRVHETEPELGTQLRTVEVSGRSFETPRRSLALTATGTCEALADLEPVCRGLVELYRELTREALRLIDGNADRQQEFADVLFRRVNALRGGSDQAVLLALSMQEKGYCPTGAEAEHLADLAGAPFVQLTMVPRVLPRDLDSFLAYAKDFLAAYSGNGSPALLGYLPNFARRDIQKVLALYLKKGIQNFVMDFNGNHAQSLYPNFLLIRRTLNHEVGEGWYMHGLNVGPGVFRRAQQACPARDFLGLLLGLDTVGPKHIVRRMPPEVWAKLIQQGGAGNRVFHRGDYGYYEPRRLPAGARSADRGRISLREIIREPTAAMVRFYNAERHGIEAEEVRRQLGEGSLVPYVMGKALLREDLAQIRVRQSQTTLGG